MARCEGPTQVRFRRATRATSDGSIGHKKSTTMRISRRYARPTHRANGLQARCATRTPPNSGCLLGYSQLAPAFLLCLGPWRFARKNPTMRTYPVGCRQTDPSCEGLRWHDGGDLSKQSPPALVTSGFHAASFYSLVSIRHYLLAAIVFPPPHYPQTGGYHTHVQP